MTIPEVAGVFGLLVGAVLTVLNIRKSISDSRKAKDQALIDASTVDEQRLTIVANSAQVATGFLQDVLKRADKEIMDRDLRIEILEAEVKELRKERISMSDRITQLERRLAAFDA